MKTYTLTAHYATWTGHMASCRRTVRAASSAEAAGIVADRVRKFKRYMGKLSID
jgi:hypothetical protein